jgi:hypothetical protein
MSIDSSEGPMDAPPPPAPEPPEPEYAMEDIVQPEFGEEGELDDESVDSVGALEAAAAPADDVTESLGESDQDAEVAESDASADSSDVIADRFEGLDASGDWESRFPDIRGDFNNAVNPPEPDTRGGGAEDAVISPPAPGLDNGPK